MGSLATPLRATATERGHGTFADRSSRCAGVGTRPVSERTATLHLTATLGILNRHVKWSVVA